MKTQGERYLDHVVGDQPIVRRYRVADFDETVIVVVNTYRAPSFVELDGLRLALIEGEEATVNIAGKPPRAIIGFGPGVRLASELPSQRIRKDLFDGST